MQYDLQCKGVLTESFLLPHRFDHHMVDVKDYINEEMNAHLSSAPDSYDQQHNVILKPVTRWTLRTTLDPAPTIDSNADFQEGDTETFKFVRINGTSNYTVTAKPTTVPLSTNVVPYAFRNRVSLSREQFNALTLDTDITNFNITLYTTDPETDTTAQEPGYFFENHTYDLWVKVSIDQPPTDELLLVLESSDSVFGEFSLYSEDENSSTPCVFQFLPSQPLEQVHRIHCTTKEVQNRSEFRTEENSDPAYRVEELDIRLRTIKSSTNSHIVLKKWPKALQIRDAPILSNIVVTNTQDDTDSPWEQFFTTGGNDIQINFNSDGPLEEGIEPKVIFEIKDANGVVLAPTPIILSGGTVTQDAWNQYTWTYTTTISADLPSGVFHAHIEDRDDYHVQ